MPTACSSVACMFPNETQDFYSVLILFLRPFWWQIITVNCFLALNLPRCIFSLLSGCFVVWHHLCASIFWAWSTWTLQSRIKTEYRRRTPLWVPNTLVWSCVFSLEQPKFKIDSSMVSLSLRSWGPCRCCLSYLKDSTSIIPCWCYCSVLQLFTG